jgi:hypothetical protein
MSFSDNLDLTKKNSNSSENGIGKLFESSNYIKQKDKKEKDTDSDDYQKKFGKVEDT